MLIEITYNVTDVYMSTTETPVYVEISFEQPGGTSAVWGSITGTLSNQTDLQNALNAKFDDPTGTTAQYLRGDGSLATFPSLTGYVPYTGATQAVNLGAYDLTVNELTIGKGLNGVANNTALGKRTLFHNTTGNYNTAVGHEAGHNLTTGQYNTAIGQSAMFTATTAGQNTAIGVNALLLATSGGSNVAVGLDTLQHITTGSSNTAIGYNAGSHITGGSTPNTTATNSVFIGRDSKAAADGQTNQIVIGQNAVGNGSNTATFGNTATTANYFTGSVNGGSFVKSGGTSSQFLKADGSVDSTAYVSTTRTITINGVSYDLSADRTWTISAGISGSGTAGRVTFWSGTSSISSSADFTYNDTTKALTINGVSISRGGNNPVESVAIGLNALGANTTGGESVAVGRGALSNNTTGIRSVAIGYNAQAANTTGSRNTSFGYYSLYGNTGSNNTGVGQETFFIASGSNNVGIGSTAGKYISDGVTTATSINNSVLIGFNTQPLADSQTNQVVIGYQAIGLGSNTTVVGNSSTTFGRWWGNLLLGTSTNTGERLQVIGDTLLRGSGATSATTALTVQNSASSNLLRILNDGTHKIGGQNIDIYPTANGSTLSNGGRGLIISTNASSQTDVGALKLIGAYSSALGSDYGFWVSHTFTNGTGGTATHSGILLNQTINQTGGANGITRGLYINPTLTAAADFRAIETARGNIVFSNLPTSSAGLPSGALWNNGGVINIV